MPEINLLRSEKKKTFHIGVPTQMAGGGLIWVFLGIIVLDLAVYGILFFLGSKTVAELNTVNSATGEADAKMRKPEPEFTDAVKAQSALESLSGLLNGHIYWTKLWDKLGESTLRKVQYLSISATSDDKRFILTGKAENYSDLGKLILGLQSAGEFEDVQLVSSGASKGEDAAGIDFSIAVQFSPALIRQSLQNGRSP